MLEKLLIANQYIVEYPNVITLGGVILLVFLFLFLWRAKIKEAINEYELKQLLKNIGVDARHNIVIADGIDETIFIEHLILMPDEIFILGVKKFRGLIFAAEKIELWTQVVGNKSYKFENPLLQLESSVVTLNSKTKESKIGKKVLFISGSTFPKGKPDNIVSIEKVKAWRRNLIQKNVPDSLQKDWEMLLALEIKDDFVAESPLLAREGRWLGRNMFSIVSLFLLIGGWLFLRLM